MSENRKNVRLGPLGGLEGVDSEEDRPLPPYKIPPPNMPSAPMVPVTQIPNPLPTYAYLNSNWEQVNEISSE